MKPVSISKYLLIQLCLIAAVFFSSSNVLAHLAVQTDTSVDVTQKMVRIIYTTQDANLALISARGDTQTQILRGFSVYSGSARCRSELHRVSPLKGIQSTQFYLDFYCPKPLETLHIKYDLLFDIDDAHDNIVRMRIAGRLTSSTLTANKRELELPVQRLLTDWSATLADAPDTEGEVEEGDVFNMTYLKIGIEHILTGYDHLLFLLVLFCVPMSLSRTLWVISGFTVAHSITLSLAVLDVVSFPAAMAELIIALSIVITGAENVCRVLQLRKYVAAEIGWTQKLKYRWVESMAFGLIHGFGFSSALKEIGLGKSVGASLLLFNVGVELGQLLVFIVSFPILYLLFKSSYKNSAIMMLSLTAILLGGYWTMQRFLIL